MEMATRSVPPLSFVWYDPEVCEKENEIALELLLSLYPGTLFKEKDSWNRLFGRDFTKKQLLIITTGRLGKDLVPKIHDLPNIISIYIYCGDDKAHREWTEKYPKVRDYLSVLITFFFLLD